MSRVRLVAVAAAVTAVVVGCGTGGSPTPTTLQTTNATTTTTFVASATSHSPNPSPVNLTADPSQFRSSDSGDVSFVSPTKNIWCRLGAEKYSAGCQAKTAPVPSGAEKSCAGNEMYPASSLSKGFWLQDGSVVPSCFNQGVFSSPNPKALPYDYSITANGLTCTSRTTGMTCTNRDGHGFELSMTVARSF